MTDARLLVWHLIASPLAGAVMAVGLYATAVRPWLPGPAWLLDAGAVACGTLGLVAGGIFGFAVSPRRSARRSPRHGWRMLGTFGLSTGALVAALLLVGLPVLTWPVLTAAVIGGAAAAWKMGSTPDPI